MLTQDHAGTAGTNTDHLVATDYHYEKLLALRLGASRDLRVMSITCDAARPI